jgi:hypothetical protein
VDKGAAVEVDGCAVNLYNRVKRKSIGSSEVDMFCNGKCRAQCYEKTRRCKYHLRD